MNTTKESLLNQYDAVTCGSFVIDCQNRLLIVHPTGNQSIHWSIPKGLVDERESLYDAAVRELREETSVNIHSYKHQMHPMGSIGYTHKSKSLSGFVFLLDDTIYQDIICTSTFTDRKTNIRLPECDLSLWMNVDKAMDYIQPEQKDLFRRFSS